MRMGLTDLGREGAGVIMFDEHQENEINRQALFSDETQDYRYPEEPDAGETVTLGFRTAKNDVDRVFLY